MREIQNINNQNKDDSIILNLERLKTEFDNVLMQYNKVNTDYIDYLSSNKNNEFVEIKGQSFWGSGSVNNSINSNIANVEQCKSLCASNSNCTGATFNSTDHNTNVCLLRRGEGISIPSLENDYAIIEKSTYYLNLMKVLNTRLMGINRRISRTIESAEPLYGRHVVMRNDQNTVLQETYQKLLKQRNDIQNKLEKFNEIKNENDNSNIIINKNYYWFILLFIIVVISIIILVRISVYSGNTTSNVNKSISESIIKK